MHKNISPFVVGELSLPSTFIFSIHTHILCCVSNVLAPANGCMIDVHFLLFYNGCITFIDIKGYTQYYVVNKYGYLNNSL